MKTVIIGGVAASAACAMTRRMLVAMVIALLASAMHPHQGSSKERAEGDGKALFQAKCSPCHTIGGGRLVGPDLKGVTARRDRGWLERFISAPDKVLASGDPVAARLFQESNKVPMPNLGLGQDQVNVLLNYLSAPEGISPSKAEPPASPVQEEGDPSRGEKFFTGALPFAQGGTPCIACHQVAGIPPLGGGALGPDLTTIVATFGDTALSSALATLPFPTMKPIFGDHPLTRGEQGDLLAFFRKVAPRPPVTATTRIALWAGGGFLVLLLLTGALGRRRLGSVRGTLVDEANRAGR
ncbi:cytochrome c, class I [Geobacter metallireducens RCH3]|uniref:Respiratory nitrate reductase, cytochrome c n=1 Tax=Geobacter metallireducens (strain ATCC 53774 / DSM 7210 / GS-15) TaxID=269799 RepID=Q39WW3_GEOMG|nr:c-type cytochrome [Geobacter metallireducens]ABB31261.1 respiratory nitrate reductase, cytochrome c [Geobacter metallireducens GS-15]EHP86504.1 cytochrome c, class I [Geobacter metallireducens RCH3]